MIKLLGLNGSVRATSSNGRLLAAAVELATADASLTLAAKVSVLPHFNPDTADEQLVSHAPLAAFVNQVRECDGLVVSSPVYAGGYPGALKNALDWLVGTDAFVDKPFLLLNASNRVPSVAESLASVLRTMSGREIANTSINLLGSDANTTAILANTAHVTQIKTALIAFTKAIAAGDTNASTSGTTS